MTLLLRKKWILPAILNKTIPNEPSAQILRFTSLPNEQRTFGMIELSDKFNYISAVLTKEAMSEFYKQHPTFVSITKLSGAIIALKNYAIKPSPDWSSYLVEIYRFNFIVEGSDTAGDPVPIKHEEIAHILKDSKERNGLVDDSIEDSFSQASQLVQIADLLSQVDDSVNQSVRRANKKTKEAEDEMELSDSDFVIPEDQKKKLDNIPGWAEEELSQNPSQLPSVNQSIVPPSISQSIHKEPAKASAFYQNQPPLELALDASIEGSDNDNQSKDQDQMSIERDIYTNVAVETPKKSAAEESNRVDNAPKVTPQKNDITIDEEETQGPEDLASYLNTQSLPMTLSTNDLAQSAEKPAESTTAVQPEAAGSKSQSASNDNLEAPQKSPIVDKPTSQKSGHSTKEVKKKKKREKSMSSDLESGDLSQKSTGDISAKSSQRSTRSKKKTSGKTSTPKENNESSTPTQKKKKDEPSKKKKEKSTGEKKDKRDVSDKSSPKSSMGEKSEKHKSKSGSSDKKKSETGDKSAKSPRKSKSKKDKTKEKKKHKARQSSEASASANPSQTSVAEATPKPVEVQLATEAPAIQSIDAASTPQPEVPASTQSAAAATPLDAAPAVVVHVDTEMHVSAEGNEDNKIYDDQNRTIPNLNEEMELDSMMQSFHQELESASQLDLNAVPDYVIDVDPEKLTAFPIVKDLGSPLISSRGSSQGPSQQLGFHFGHSNQEFSLGMPSDASSQARNVASGSQASVGEPLAVNNSNANNLSDGSEENKTSSSVSQELISGSVNTSQTSPMVDKQQLRAGAGTGTEKNSLLEEMLMSDPLDANNITDSQADVNDSAEYFTQLPDMLGDSESQWMGAIPTSTQGVVPVVPQSQGDLHSEFFSSSDESAKDKQSQNSGQVVDRPSAPENTNLSPTSKKDGVSPKARRLLEFSEKNPPTSPTKSPSSSAKQNLLTTSLFKFSLSKATTTGLQKRINLSTKGTAQQPQLTRVLATSPPKFKRPDTKSPPRTRPVEPATPALVDKNIIEDSQKSAEEPVQSVDKVSSLREDLQELDKEQARTEPETDAVDQSADQFEADEDLEIVSEQRRPEDEDMPPLIRVNSTDIQEEATPASQLEKRPRSNSSSPKASSGQAREDQDRKPKHVIDLEDLSPRFFNKNKKVKRADKSVSDKTRLHGHSSHSHSAHSSQETSASPQRQAPTFSARGSDPKAVKSKRPVEKKSPPSARPTAGSLGDLIRQSRTQTLASKDPTMEFVIGYFKDAGSEAKTKTNRSPINTNNGANYSRNNNNENTTIGVKRKIDYYGWLDLTSNKKQKVEHNRDLAKK